MNIRFADGGSGTASIETGKHGGEVLVIRRGYPVAAEVVAGIKREMVSGVLLAALDISDAYAVALDVESLA